MITPLGSPSFFINVSSFQFFVTSQTLPEKAADALHYT